MSTALVLGNGESRSALDLNRLSIEVITIGCNAIHRDFIPDILICCDQKMVKEAIDNISIKRILTRKQWINYFNCNRLGSVPDLPWVEDSRPMQAKNWGSGSYALLTACEIGFEEIYIAGFDLYGQNGLVNNIYKNTDNYLKDNQPCVDYSYWILQQSKIFQRFNDIIFYIVNLENWNLPTEWQITNVKLIKFNEVPIVK